MTLLGLDFDNTLVKYDRLFYALAIERKLIDKNTPENKIAIRDFLRREGKEEQFTLLQAEVYGKRILEAEAADGMLESLKEISDHGISMVLISHKTKTPYKGPKYDLHEAAWNWLEKNNFFDPNGLNWRKEQVFFEETKNKKIARIIEQGCTHYIDDLEEILEMIPNNVRRIKYGTVSGEGKKKEIIELKNWREVKQYI